MKIQLAVNLIKSLEAIMKNELRIYKKDNLIQQDGCTC